MKKINLQIYKKVYPATSERKKIDTVESRKINRNLDILIEAHNAWQGLDKFRKEGDRNEMYTFGNQWGDHVYDPRSGKRMTEEEYIKAQGKIPLKNNLIQALLKTILGQFIAAQTVPVCTARDRGEQQLGEMMTMAMQANYSRNQMQELDARNFEAFCITGAAFFKDYFGWRDGVDLVDEWTDAINYHRIFFDNNMEDPRHWDCTLIGEIHDIGIDDVVAQFSDGSREKAIYLKEIYRSASREMMMERIDNLCGDRLKDMDFLIPSDGSRCRVIEVWRKESKERLRVHDKLTGEYYKIEIEAESRLKEENDRRIEEQSLMGVEIEDMKLIEYQWFVDRYWYYRFLTPYGEVLREGESPYWHKSHPYSFKLHPFFNGEVHSFIAGAIDQQRYLNRLITMQDFIMGAAAKGVLMFPEDSKPDNMSMEEIADSWISYDGIIYYKAKPGVEPPRQIIANTTQTGAYEMIALQMNLFKEVTGVFDALKGQQPTAGTPAASFSMQQQNSATNLTDLFEAYKQLRVSRDTKKMKLIQQFYTDVRYINIVGNGYSNEIKVFDPDKVRNIEFDLAITESVSTPAYRMMQNDLLMQLLNTGQITVEMFLKNGSFPFADKLLQDINTYKSQLAEQQAQQQQLPNTQLSPVTGI